MVDINSFLEDREKQNTLRILHPVEKRKGCKVFINNHWFVDFSSNDYLGLSTYKKNYSYIKKILNKYGTGAVASRLLSGDLLIHHILEERTACFKKKEACLIFNSGYQANVGIISALYSNKDVIFLDRLSHASLIDGALLSGAKLLRFNHNDLNHLELLLKKERPNYKNALIVTESVFSMDGDFAPLKEIVELKEKYSCELLVDEAHATGIYGENGCGLVDELGLTDKVELIMGTYSKALASFGSYLATTEKIKKYLINTSRSFIYSTAMPPIVVACILKNLEISIKEKWRREKVKKLAAIFRQKLQNSNISVKGDSQINVVIIGENKEVIETSDLLKKKKFWVLPIRPPTVPKGQSRIRISITANHDEFIINKLADEIIKILK